MYQRKHILFVLSLLLLSVSVRSQSIFQIVESVPVETILEESKLPRAADVWVEMIKFAKKSIDMETFYIANEKGEPLELVIKEIIAAANRGVQVRIIIDENFFSRYPESDNVFRNIPNISLKKIQFGKIAGGVMHAKYFVVDKEDLFLGSQNFDYRALKHIHELGVRVKDKNLAAMFMRIFETDWQLCDDYSDASIKRLKSKSSKKIYTYKNKRTLNTIDYGKVKLYPAFSPNDLVNKGFAKEETELVRFIRNAKDKLYINYFSYSTKGKDKDSPYTTIDDELRKAAERGVDVKIIFSDWAIKKDAINRIKELSQVKGIEVKLSTIPQYSEGFIPYSRVQHCKMMVSDKYSWISTANFERSYFYECRNATFIIDNRKVKEELEIVFMRVWNSSYAEKIDVNKEYKPVKRD